MLSTIFLSVLVALSAAAPTEKRDWINRVTPTVKLAGSPLDGQKINANYGGFFIGKKTTLGPCAGFAPCDTYSNNTAINFNQDKTIATMDSDAPGGQQLYVAFAGQLSFTFPGDGVPSDGYGTPFIRTEYFPTDGSANAGIIFRGANWVACPTMETGVYQVWAAGIAHESTCIPFEMAATENLPNGGIGSTFQYAISPQTEG